MIVEIGFHVVKEVVADSLVVLFDPPLTADEREVIEEALDEGVERIEQSRIRTVIPFHGNMIVMEPFLDEKSRVELGALELLRLEMCYNATAKYRLHLSVEEPETDFMQ